MWIYKPLLSLFFLKYFVSQALDTEKMKSTFESFCHTVVNKGQQIVHKLLGDQFKVWNQYFIHVHAI